MNGSMNYNLRFLGGLVLTLLHLSHLSNLSHAFEEESPRMPTGPVQRCWRQQGPLTRRRRQALGRLAGCMNANKTEKPPVVPFYPFVGGEFPQ